MRFFWLDLTGYWERDTTAFSWGRCRSRHCVLGKGDLIRFSFPPRYAGTMVFFLLSASVPSALFIYCKSNCSIVLSSINVEREGCAVKMVFLVARLWNIQSDKSTDYDALTCKSQRQII